MDCGQQNLMKALPIVVKVLCWILWQPIKRATSPVSKVVEVFICWFFSFLFLDMDQEKESNPDTVSGEA